jgi:hypothetical protein
MKHIIQYRPLPGQKLVFTDYTPMNRILKKPRKGEICLVRDVGPLLSGNCGIYLEGYFNPTKSGKREQKYNPRSFLPVELARIYLKELSNGTVDVLPTVYNEAVIILHKLLIKYFEERRVLKEAHSDGNGIDAAFSAPFGNAPLKIRYDDDRGDFSRCFAPIRIPTDQTDRVSELVNRLNQILPSPKLGIDYSRHLAYASATVDPTALVTNDDAIQILVTDCVNLAHVLFGCMTKVLYEGKSPKEVVDSLDERVQEKSGAKKEASDPHNRIKGLMGGNPELN